MVTVTDSSNDSAVDRLRAAVEQMMNLAWREPGFCVPNQDTYPHQWLWDSCFHALIWNALGSNRAVTEVASALSVQDADGFVPHMIYWHQPELHAEFWRRSGSSSITQPPMYGHTIAELIKAGHEVAPDVIDRARRGLAYLGSRPRSAAGLIPVFHPWETGCDDSARWDSWLPDSDSGTASDDRFTRWKRRKGEMVASLELSPDGHVAGNEQFTVGSVGFNALVAWNASELASVSPDSEGLLRSLADEVGSAVVDRWQHDRWVDDGPASGRARTLDAMLALLIDPRSDGFESLIDPEGFGARYGPRGLHLDEDGYEPNVYWRGPAWPQLSYLMMIAAEQADHRAAPILAARLAAGAERSGLAEYWNPETGEGLGAKPQSWAGLALLAATR